MATSEELAQIDISKEEKDKLVNDVMRYVLFKTHQASGCPIKREELTGIITKNYRQRGLPTLIINEARDRLAATFGYEMRELQRTRAPSTRFGRASEPQPNAEAKSYVLVSQIDPELKRLGLMENDDKHPVFGNNKQALERLVQQRYLLKEKLAGPEGHVVMYELAERALDESTSGSLKAYISKIVGTSTATEETSS
ncbi:hypothetical protein PVAP13_2NG040200 [Panicum virgatum]|uniref:MAGE domain-containing protein n=1 Tax=Panicum virgatum TaxID=38727 RepID=A0A8T0VBB8_PANVG|nr:hypothetical protein PVAP13_2NG040200 [Panicum virgatum]